MKVICRSRARSLRPSVETLHGAPHVGEEKVQTTNAKAAGKPVVVSNFGIPLISQRLTQVEAGLKLRELQGHPNVKSRAICSQAHMGRFRGHPKGVGSRDKDPKREASVAQMMKWSDLYRNVQRYRQPGRYRNISDGRGSLDIARQVKAETGTSVALSELQNDIDEMMVTWKTKTYATAWSYMEDCAARVVDPGYIVNPWGRMRRFPEVYENRALPGMQRQSQNFNIQSTVADTCCIALQKMVEYRSQHNMKFRIMNQIHDAFIIEVAEDEVDAAKVMFQETMGSIDIPIRAGKTLRLGIDIDLMTRWGEKVK